jgi:cytochrome c-type biogenesis protein
MIADATESLSRWWAPAVAFTAGIVSFASPCVFPLVPGYLSFVTGESVAGIDREQASTVSTRTRTRNLLPILLFIAGFTLVFTLYGAFSTTFVRIFKGRTGQVIAGLVVIAVGLLLVGYAIGRGWLALYAERRPFLRKVRPGVTGSFPLGMAFAAGWTPCIGTVLSAILTMAAASGGALRGATLLAIYSLGLGVPFLLLGLGVQWLTGTLEWVRRHYRGISVVSGAVLVVLGVMLLTGTFTRYLNAPLLRFRPGL